MSRRGRSGADPGIQGLRTGGWTGEQAGGGRSVGRSVGQVRWRGGTGRVVHVRAGGGEGERDIYLFLREDRQEVVWRGKGSLHAPLIWTTHADAPRTLDRARASPGHHHLSIYMVGDSLCRSASTRNFKI